MLRKDILRPLQPAAGKSHAVDGARKHAPTPTISPAERAKFNALATEWHNPNGAFKQVHAFNQARLEWLFNLLRTTALWPTPTSAPPHKKAPTVLDIGCAAGLVCEAFAKQGFCVHGVDAAARNIEIARAHAAQHNLPLTYTHALAEETTGQHDVVLCLEVVEHVENLPAFLNAAAARVKPGGYWVLATLNRTVLSYVLAIFMAEYVLRWLPRGTHSWRMFVKPATLRRVAAQHGFAERASTGLSFNPLTWRWNPTRSLMVNYMLVFQQQA